MLYIRQKPVGGDFNIMRTVLDKNKPSILPHSSDLFNSIINTFGLGEIYMTGGKYTWSNEQKCPTLEKLDRILMSPCWEALYTSKKKGFRSTPLVPK
jgi:hypothetical protein